MAQLNKKCLCCGTKYSYCPSCSRADALKESWYSEFCSATCKDLWLTLTRYNMGTHSKAEAKTIISALDIKPIDTYVECVKRDYVKVMMEDKKPKRGKRSELKIFDDAMNIEPAAVEPESHVVVLEEKK